MRTASASPSWRLCSAAFANYADLDLIGAERSEKVEFLERRDVAPIMR